MSRSFFLNKQGINLGTRTTDPADGVPGSFYYNSASGKLRVYNGTSWKNVGSGSGFGDVDTLAVDSAEESVLADYTQTGLEILASTGLMHQDSAFRLIHQSGSTRSFKKTVTTDTKFRGKNITLSLDVKSSAQSSSLSILVRDETNSKDLVPVSQIQTDSISMSVTTTSASAQLAALSVSDYNTVRLGMIITGPGIPTGTTVSSKNDATRIVTLSAAATASATITARLSSIDVKRNFTFQLADNTASISWTISALAEANSPESYFDDISMAITTATKTSSAISVTTKDGTVVGTGYAELTGQLALTGTFPVDNTIPQITEGSAVLSTSYTPKRAGNKIRIYVTGSLAEATNSGDVMTFALFKNGGADAIAAGYSSSTVAGATPLNGGMIQFTKEITAASTSTITFDLRGGNNGGNSTVNLAIGNGVTGNFGGIIPTSIRIEEIQVGDYVESQNVDVGAAVLVAQTDSYLKINTLAGRGSTGTSVYRFTNITSAIGSDIQYNSSAVNGDSFVALTAGTYTINYSQSGDVSNNYEIALTLNSPSLTASPDGGIASQYILDRAYNSSSASTRNPYKLSWTGKLNAGDVVRIQGVDSTTYSSAQAEFSMAKQNSLRILNPSSDQKIEIPSSEARLEGCSSMGSTDTAVLKFDSLVSFRGDGFSVTNTAANGTVITILKDGKLDIAFGVFATAHNYVISRNPSTLTALPTTSAERLAVCSTATTYGNASWKGTVKVGEVFRIMGNGAPTSDIGNSLVIRHEETKVGVALSNVTPQFVDGDAYLDLDTQNGYGSTYTKVLRFSNARQDSTGKLTYTDSATDGMSVTVNESGLYFIKATAGASNNNATEVSISKNEVLATTGTTSGTSMTAAQGLISTGYVGAISTGLSVPTATHFGYFAKGDVIRVKGNGLTNGNPNISYFNMVKVGKPSLTSVDVTPFINLKAQDFEAIRLSGNSLGYGSTATKIPRFGTVQENTNKGILAYAEDAVNGTTFTATRDCRVVASWQDVLTTQGSLVGWSLNASSVTSTVNGLAAAQYLGAGQAYGANTWASSIITVDMKAGDILRPHGDGTGRNSTAPCSVTVYAVADSTSVVSTATTYRMSDYLATGSRVTGADPTALGQYRVMYRAAATNHALSDCTSIATPPSTANGMFIKGDVAYNAAGTASIPQFYRIFIGKNKTFSTTIYENTGRTGSADGDSWVSSNQECGTHVRYDPTTGLLEVDAAWIVSSSNTVRYLANKAGGSVILTGYFDVTVFDTPYVSVAPVQLAVNVTGAVQSTGTASVTNLIWPTVTKDTAGMYNASTGNITAPKDGWYSIQAYANTNVAIFTPLLCYVDGVQQAPYMGLTWTANGLLFGSGIFYAKKGQLIALRAGAGWSASAAAGSGMSVAYIGSTYL